MKTRLIIGLLLVSLLLMTGCQLEGKSFCISHSDITIERLGQREWNISEGVMKIKIIECEDTEDGT